jgi:protein O-mannosyl-transferase
MSSSSSIVTPGPAARLTALWVVLLVVSVAWTGREIPGFAYALLMDDDTNILFNPHLGQLDGARLWWMFTDMRYVARYMPLGWLSFNFVATWDELSPVACHVASVVFHALNSVLVFFCLRRLIGRFVAGTSPSDAAVAAGVGALLWALHPLRMEAVAWCSGLIYVEGGFFALLSVYARLRELEARTGGGGRPRFWFGVALGSFALSLLVYPVALFLPGILLLLDYAWLRKENRPLFGVAGRELGCLIVLSGAALWATIHARHIILIANGLPPPSLAEFGLVPRAFQAGYVWASYLWRTIWPIGLTPGVEALFEIRPGDARIWAPFPVLIAITWLAWRGRRVAPYAGVCWAGYLLWMVPVLGLTEYPHVAADRYSYLVSVLFSVALVFCLLQIRSASARRVSLAVCAAAAATCALLSTRQARIWRDAFTIHEQMLSRFHDPDLRNIALARIAKLQFLAGNVRDGRALAEKIYAQAPAVAGVERSWREMRPAQPIPPEVAAQPLQEWRSVPWAFLHESIAREHLKSGRTRDGLVRLNAALALSPGYVEARFRRALVLAELGRGRAALHDWLVAEVQNNGRVLAPEGMQFAAHQVAGALRAQGDEALAQALEKRAGTK